MAKYTAVFQGDLNQFAQYIQQEVLHGSISASLEEEQEMCLDDAPHIRCIIQNYERYSWAGGNRVSLNVTMLTDGEWIHLTAITAGGSQAMFFKINTWGEESFLEVFEEIVKRYQP